MPVRIVSWNLAGRVRIAPLQLEALLRLRPTVVALQEVTHGSWPRLAGRLAGAGYEAVHTLEALPRSRATGPRRFALAIAARVRPRAVEATVRHPWRERVLLADLSLPGGRLRVVTAHVPPGSSNGWNKVQVLEGLAAELAAHRRRATVFVGDLNCPQEELPDGRIVTWAQTRVGNDVRTRKRLRGRDASRWHEAERALTEGLSCVGYVDAYRQLHGPPRGASDYSWYARARSRPVGRRFDHAFCTSRLQVLSCRYVTTFREHGLSDHAPVDVTVGQ